MANLLKTEALIDDIINAFISKLDNEFVLGENADKPCDMGKWLMFFSWDVVGQLTFSKTFEFIEKGYDHNKMLDISERAIEYFAVVGQLPELDHWLAKNPVCRIGPPSFEYGAIFAAQQMMARKQSGGSGINHKDMLNDFLEMQKENPDIMDDNGVVRALLINVLAGADTTSVLLRAIVYYVLKNPPVYRKLRQEIDAASLSSPVSYSAASKLPYLDAVVMEASRMHPALGAVLERTVPAGGLMLTDGRVLPEGTIVGFNPWILHQNAQIFGQDAASFNPSRWLRNIEEETEEQYQARLGVMKSHDLTFGHGNRVCLGRHVAILETFKVMATLFMNYDVSGLKIKRRQGTRKLI
jgi:hypothetical protein